MSMANGTGVAAANALALIAASLVSAAAHAGGTVAYADGKTTYGGFGSRSDNLTPVAAESQSSFRISDVGKALKIELFAKCAFPERLRTAGAATFGKWPSADCFEIFLAAPGQSGYVQLALGAAGSMWDSRTKGASREDYGWSGKAEATADGWCGEVLVPYAWLGVKPPEKGDKWRFNIARDYLADGKPGLSTWAPVGGVFNNPEKFATLYMCSAEELAAALGEKSAREFAALRKELAEQGLEGVFDARLSVVERGAPAEIAAEIRDEAKVVLAIGAGLGGAR